MHRHRRAHPHNWITADQVAELQAQYIQEAADIDAKLEKETTEAATAASSSLLPPEQLAAAIVDKEPVDPSTHINGIEQYLAHFSADVLHRLTTLEAAAARGQS